jgi:glycosyltransferase involved in cell wall biosynthesis
MEDSSYLSGIPPVMQGLGIVHFGSFSTSRPCGIANAGAMLTKALVSQGHRVTIATPASGVHESSATDPSGIQTIYYRRQKSPLLFHSELDVIVNELRNRQRLDMAHLYSVFTPENEVIRRILKRHGIPYVWSPQGGLDEHIMKRGRIKKLIYWNLYEQRLMHEAAAIHCLTSREMERLRQLGYTGRTEVMGNIVDAPDSLERRPESRIIFMGRDDIHHKGLDRLVRLFGFIAKQIPGVSLHLYGCPDAGLKLANEMNAIGPYKSRIVFHSPVYDREKARALAEASVYIQASRWEGFGVSIAEAMVAGVPVMVSRECALSAFLEQSGGGRVLDDFSEAGASQVVAMLRDTEAAASLGACGMDVAGRNFSSRVIAEQMLQLYQSVLKVNA